MGKQIAIRLTSADEERLVAYLAQKYSATVIDGLYPPYWDHRTLTRNPRAPDWLIICPGTEQALIESATQATTGPLQGWWTIRSRGECCIDWDRPCTGGVFTDHGRLYLDTMPHPIDETIHGLVGDGVPKLYQAAVRWVRQNCVNASESRSAFWISRSLVEARPVAEQDDPRDDVYYQLQRRKKTTLSAEELALYMTYCDRMMVYVRKDRSAVASWESLKGELQQLLPAQQ